MLKVRLSCPSGVTTHATTVFLCTSKPAQRSGMIGITTAAQRDHGEHGYLHGQILTGGLKGHRGRCLQGSGSDWWTGAGAPLCQPTSGPAAEPELYHMFMRGGDLRS